MDQQDFFNFQQDFGQQQQQEQDNLTQQEQLTQIQEMSYDQVQQGEIKKQFKLKPTKSTISEVLSVTKKITKPKNAGQVIEQKKIEKELFQKGYQQGLQQALKQKQNLRAKVNRQNHNVQQTFDQNNMAINLKKTPNVVFMKTKMCPHYSSGNCVNGTKCKFAHNELELRPLPNLKKTKICLMNLQGRCQQGMQCNFIHDVQVNQNQSMQVQRTPKPHLDLFKSSMCTNFVKKGICQHADKCKYAHGEHELRAPQLQQQQTIMNRQYNPYGSQASYGIPPPQPIVDYRQPMYAMPQYSQIQNNQQGYYAQTLPVQQQQNHYNYQMPQQNFQQHAQYPQFIPNKPQYPM